MPGGTGSHPVGEECVSALITSRGTDAPEAGFTLLELLAGLAVGSLLVLAVFQFLHQFYALNHRLRSTTREEHVRTVLTRLLWTDVNNQPVGEPNLEGREREFARTTATYQSQDHLLMDTRVRYFVDERNNQQALIREWKWPAIHSDTQPGTVLLRADEIRFEYQLPRGDWIPEVRGGDTVTQIRLHWADQNLVVPRLDPG